MRGLVSIFSLFSIQNRRYNSRLTSNNGISIDVCSYDNLDDIFGFEGLSSSFLVTWDRGEVLNDVVDGNSGWESDTCARKSD